MELYIALLRGINVGGKNKISMSHLKQALLEIGFEDVLTYINSGNIIFCSSIKDKEEIKTMFEQCIYDSFHLDIRVHIIRSSDFIEALSHAPLWWNQGADKKHNAIFVIEPTRVEEIYEEVGEIKPEYEEIGYFNQVIFWSAPLSTFSRTRLSKIVSKTAYQKVTIRNANTTLKLLELLKRKVT